ncbi:odorant receptor 43a-like [Schistocerca cancellata]|uniref:odorant receptor 43a-like n=1 Tax=Schistocerca cancellata TaxID=274614 RepID=UPI0021183611|nr:odorant receptor 43a-like [Schistocerca cancellata]
MDSLSVDGESLLGPGEGLMRMVGMWQPQEASRRLPPAARACLTLVSIAFLSVALFIKHGTTFRQLIQLLVKTRVQHNEVAGDECKRRRCQRHVQRLYLLLKVAVVAGLIDWLSSPLVSRALLGDDESSRQLPLPLWLPGDVYVSPTYEILYAVQCVALTIASKNYEQPARARDRGELSEYQTTKETLVLSCAKIYADCVSDEQMHRQLAKNIQHHQILLRSISILQTTMSVPTFFILAINIINLCGNLFISIVSEKLMQSAFSCGWTESDVRLRRSLLLFMTATARPVEITVGKTTKLSKETLLQSEKLMPSAFNCDCTECEVRFRRSLFIFMTATVEPVEITVGKTTKLSKQTLVQVLNGTYGLLNMPYHIYSNL